MMKWIGQLLERIQIYVRWNLPQTWNMNDFCPKRVVTLSSIEVSAKAHKKPLAFDWLPEGFSTLFWPEARLWSRYQQCFFIAWQWRPCPVFVEPSWKPKSIVYLKYGGRQWLEERSIKVKDQLYLLTPMVGNPRCGTIEKIDECVYRPKGRSWLKKPEECLSIEERFADVENYSYQKLYFLSCPPWNAVHHAIAQVSPFL